MEDHETLREIEKVSADICKSLVIVKHMIKKQGLDKTLEDSEDILALIPNASTEISKELLNSFERLWMSLVQAGKIRKQIPM